VTDFASDTSAHCGESVTEFDVPLVTPPGPGKACVKDATFVTGADVSTVTTIDNCALEFGARSGIVQVTVWPLTTMHDPDGHVAELDDW
jgi:hypothetical protein